MIFVRAFAKNELATSLSTGVTPVDARGEAPPETVRKEKAMSEENLEAILKWLVDKDPETVARLIARMRSQLEDARSALEDAKETMQDLESTASEAVVQAENSENEISEILDELDSELE